MEMRIDFGKEGHATIRNFRMHEGLVQSELIDIRIKKVCDPHGLHTWAYVRVRGMLRLYEVKRIWRRKKTVHVELGTNLCDDLNKYDVLK